MNKTFFLVLFLFFIPVFMILPVFGSEETNIIISEVDDEIFKTAVNATIISTDGITVNVANPDEVGQVFVLEQKNKGNDFWDMDLPTWISMIGLVVALVIGIFNINKFIIQRQDSLDLDFSKTLIDFEKQWSDARTSWKDDIPNTINEENKHTVLNTCTAMCSKRLSVLDSLAFLSMSEKIDEKMLEFFYFHFTEGLLYDNWLNQIEVYQAEQKKLTPSGDSSYPHFTQYTEDNDNIEMASLENLDPEFTEVFCLVTGKSFILE